jgi:hypothetical protein
MSTWQFFYHFFFFEATTFRIFGREFGWFLMNISHSMASANLNKSEIFLKNTTAASKYILKRPINPYQLKSLLSDFTFQKLFFIK